MGRRPKNATIKVDLEALKAKAAEERANLVYRFKAYTQGQKVKIIKLNDSCKADIKIGDVGTYSAIGGNNEFPHICIFNGKKISMCDDEIEETE